MRIFWFFLFLLIAASRAEACSCVRHTSEEPLVERAAYIFVGKVTAVRAPDAGDRGTAEASVSEAIKGNPGPSMKLQTGPAGNSCSMTLSVGQEYLFFVPENGSVRLCSGTRPFNRDTDRARLEQLKAYVK